MVSCAIINYETHFAVASACNALNNGRPQRSCGESYTAGSVIRRDRMTRPGILSSIFYPRRFGPHEPSGTTVSDFQLLTPTGCTERVAHPKYPPLRDMTTRRRMSSTGSLLFDAVLTSTRCRIERCCATPFLFWPGDWHLDPKTKPVDHQTSPPRRRSAASTRRACCGPRRGIKFRCSP